MAPTDNFEEFAAKVEALEEDVRDLKKDMHAEIHDINLKVDRLAEALATITEKLVSRPEIRTLDTNISHRIEAGEKQVEKLDGRMWALVIALFLNFLSTGGYFLINLLMKGR